MDIYDIAEQIDSQPDPYDTGALKRYTPKIQQPQDIYDIAENISNQPEDIYDMAEKLDKTDLDRGALAAAGMWGGRAIAPAMAGLAAGSAAATAVAPSLGTGIPGVVLTLGTGLAAGWGAAMATSKAQDMALEAGLGKEKSQALQREMDIARKQHPIASAGGELAGNLIGLKPDKRTLASGWNFMKALTGNKAQMAEHIAKNPEGLANALNMVFGAGSQGGIEAYNQLSEGDFGPLRLVAQTLAGGLFNAPTKLGAKLMRIKAPIDTTAPIKMKSYEELRAEAKETGKTIPEIQKEELVAEQAAVIAEAPPVATVPETPATDVIKTSYIPEENKRVVSIDGKEYVFVKRNGKYVEESSATLEPATQAEIEAKIQESFPVKQREPTIPTTADALASTTDTRANDLILRNYLLDQGVPAKTLAAMKTNELKAMVNDANAIRDASVLVQPKPQPESKVSIPEVEKITDTTGMTKREKKQTAQDIRNQKRADEGFAARELARQVEEAQYRQTKVMGDQEPAPYIAPEWKAERGAIGREPRLTEEAKARIKEELKIAKQTLKEPDITTHKWAANPLMQKIEELGGIRMYDTFVVNRDGKKTRYFQEEMKALPESVRAGKATGGRLPDKMLMALQEEGFLPNATRVDELFDAIFRTKRVMSEEAWFDNASKAHATWVKSGSEPIHLSKLETGSTFKVKNEKFRVLEQGENAIHVKDGQDYWILHEDEFARIDKGSLVTAKDILKAETKAIKEAKAFAKKAALVRREKAAQIQFMNEKLGPAQKQLIDEGEGGFKLVSEKVDDAEAIVKAKEDEARIKEENRKKQIELFGSEEVAQKKKAKTANESDEELINRQSCEVEFKKGKDEKMR